MRHRTIIFSLILSFLLSWTASATEKKPVSAAPAAGPVSITGVQFLTDTGDETILMINAFPSEGVVEFSDQLVSFEGKDWLRVRIKPALVKEEKRVKLESANIGEARLENDANEKETALVSLELLPAMISYSVKGVRSSTSVMVTITNIDRHPALSGRP
ncbi:MAG: hypothetical protein HGA78_01515 [Nitrospirales bacterium]|nr:hypothetical protein [Nitrospirales bacterium]